jgi:hypothetical protein
VDAMERGRGTRVGAIDVEGNGMGFRWVRFIGEVLAVDCGGRGSGELEGGMGVCRARG